MIPEQYSFIKKPYILLSILALAVLLTASFISSYPSWKVATYKMIVSIYIVMLMIVTVEVILRHVIYCVLYKKNKMWIKEVDRPRTTITLLSAFFMYLSFTTFMANPNSIASKIFSVFICIISFAILLVCWNNMFRTKMLPKIREFIGESNPIIAGTSQFEEEELNSLVSKFKENYIKGNEKIIYKLLKYNSSFDKLLEIEECDKLEWTFQSGLRNNQPFNSQTLLSFISNLYETEDSKTLVLLVSTFFGKKYSISSKNISTWKKNNKEYLKTFENDLTRLISNRKPV